MLHFVMGRAGTGKTSRIADEIVREISSSSRPVVLLVPEQHTVAWETKMAARLPASVATLELPPTLRRAEGWRQARGSASGA